MQEPPPFPCRHSSPPPQHPQYPQRPQQELHPGDGQAGSRERPPATRLRECAQDGGARGTLERDPARWGAQQEDYALFRVHAGVSLRPATHEQFPPLCTDIHIPRYWNILEYGFARRLGCSVTVLIFVIVIAASLPGWTKQVKIDMNNEETNSLRQLAENKAAFATEVFSGISTDALLLTEFAHSALAQPDDGSTMAPDPGIPAQGWVADDTYVWQADGSEYTWDRSVYYLPGRAGAEHSFDNLPGHTQALLNRITGVDMAFRTLREQYGHAGTLLYIGLEDPDTSDPTQVADPAEQSVYITYP